MASFFYGCKAVKLFCNNKLYGFKTIYIFDSNEINTIAEVRNIDCFIDIFGLV